MSRPALLRALLALVVVTTLLTAIRGRELFVGDETKYGQVVREMRATGHVFLPTLMGTPFTHKPPLHFWLLDACTYLFGVYSIWSFALPSVAAFIFLLWVMQRHAGWLAAFVCGTSVMIWASAQTARMDVSFTAFIALAVFLLERHLDRTDRRALLGAGIALGVATLIKGPMAPVIAIVLVLFERLRRKSLPRGGWWAAAAAMIVIPLVWVVPAMLLGGSAYRDEVVMKQTVGRAVGAWVHKSPPWYYLGHLPGIALPWFFLGVVAAIAAWRSGTSRERFCLTWIAAVVVPYSLMSSKLDVYMMAMLPPLAALIASFVERESPLHRAARRANVAMIALLLAIGVAALTIGARFVKGEDAALASLPAVRGVFIVLIVASIVALLASRTLFSSTIALGLVPLAMLAYIAIALTPLANDMATTRPLVAALARQQVEADRIALYTCPHLWTHDMPRDLERVHYVDADALATMQPELIATSRAHAREIAAVLARYRKVDELRMIGKPFDVYRR